MEIEIQQLFLRVKSHYIMTMIYEYEPSLKSLGLCIKVLSKLKKFFLC